MTPADQNPDPARITPESSPSSEPAENSLADRGNNRSQRPSSDAFREFVTSGWAPRRESATEPGAFAPYAAVRRGALGGRFPGKRLVIAAGTFKVRSNDTDYRFRPHSAFAHLTGLGTDQEPDAVLVLHPDDDGGHEAILYFRPLAGRDTDEVFADSRYGEFWVGARPSLQDIETLTGIRTAHIDELADALAKDVGPGHVELQTVAEVDENVDALVAKVRAAAGFDQSQSQELDALLEEAVSELRLIKDAYEIEQMRLAVDASIDGFEQVVRDLPRALAHERGERVIETVFGAHARLEGNAVGYDTIAAAGEHATTLHWIRNDGVVRAGELLLLDAGVEVDSLYTADVTRTLPINGKFSDVQRRVYQAVLDAADAAFEVAKPGAKFRDIHDAAMVVIADRLAQWGLLPGTAEESLAPEGQFHRRWMVPGTSHHLGIDVHDCAQARREMYLDATLEPGMVFTIEPGLYFKKDDLLVPEEYRGIGVRIEDDVLVTETGNENLSRALARTPDDVEKWMASLR